MNERRATRILLGVTGGIAAYKSPDLVRRLRERGAEVQVVMTEGAKQFVTPLTFQAVSGREVRDSLWDREAEAAMGHIELARWADAVLVAPATAEFLAKLVQGRADDLLTTLCLATSAPVHVAPAMNQQMWARRHRPTSTPCAAAACPCWALAGATRPAAKPVKAVCWSQRTWRRRCWAACRPVAHWRAARSW